jgi:hypothetical protein
MKKLLTVVMAFCVMCFCVNVATACECGCENAKAVSECECVKSECDCVCPIKCKKVKKCMKKCMKKYAKKQCCCKKSAIECPVKCKKELNPENKKSVSEIITDSVVPQDGNDTAISAPKCDKAPCWKDCPCMQKCLKKYKIEIPECPKKACPLKDVVE